MTGDKRPKSVSRRQAMFKKAVEESKKSPVKISKQIQLNLTPKTGIAKSDIPINPTRIICIFNVWGVYESFSAFSGLFRYAWSRQ